MAQLKVLANKLNVRKTPVIDFANKSNIEEVILKGSIYESTTKQENMLGVWYKINNGWVHENWLSDKEIPINVQQYIDERFDVTNLKQVIDYNFLLNIPEEIKKTKGINSVIGIMDVPISTNMKFGNILRPGKISTASSPSEHGNFIAGIIGSKTVSSINGICSSATILDLAFNDKNGNPILDNNYYKKLTDCLLSFSNTKVIINVSCTLDPADPSEPVNFALEKFKELENVIFVCSAGTDKMLFDIEKSPLVGRDNAFSVGTASSEFLKSSATKIDERLNFILPILDYASFDTDGITVVKIDDLSSSWATSVITGMIALLFSNGRLNKNSSKADIVSQIRNLSNNFTDSNTFLNPLKI
jgi:hypothetical protein